MYLRADHAESSIPVLRQLIHDYPLGVVTTAITADGFPLIQSTHIPLILKVDDETSDTELGHLTGHMAKANPHAKAMLAEAAQAAQSADAKSDGIYELKAEVLVVFISSIQHYVTPKFYVETKPSTAKVVPTWNYATAQARGRATIYFGQSEAATNFLTKQLDDLSEFAEREIMNYSGEGARPSPWKVADAPPKYVDILRRNIIGIDIKLDTLEGKFKMSQEMRAGDRAGILEGFRGLGSELGENMAALVEERAAKKEAAKVV
ncbi:transcriptional regulator [Ophiostoma piceae UAMH 11346]|uniref:Transcriptional regulator n=1 Tax=Ophiostoma piceae (strain UAMH 11346) TaxID=1262450 RepID=S3BN96_OPHP1|nr:transcriptional regulator [Ophiostoma piceae UAMH 11346]